jgi:hypothetical protein
VPVFLGWDAHPNRNADWYEAKRLSHLATFGTLDNLHQEYPATDTEALSARELDKRLPPQWLDQCFVPKSPWNLDGSLHHLTVDSPPLTGAGRGLSIPGLVVYAVPQPGRIYVIGADPAEGLPAGDDSALDVLDADTGEQMATLAGKIVPAVFGHYIANLSAWYNQASVLVERNNHCGWVVDWIAQNRPEVFLLCGRDDRPGWNTSVGSKAILYDSVAEALRTKGVIIRDFGSKMQLASVEASTLSAPEGLHDDRAVSLALAHQARECRPKGVIGVYC